MTPEQNMHAPGTPVVTLSEPDLLDRIFDFLQAELHQVIPAPGRLEHLKARARAEFGGSDCYIPRIKRDSRVSEVLRLYNGRNAAEVARLLHIDRATVYRVVQRSKCAKASRCGKPTKPT